MHSQDYSIYLQIIDSVKVKPPKRLKGVSHLQQIDENAFEQPFRVLKPNVWGKSHFKLG